MQDSVTVVGYPLGGDTISVTKGVVSRIEVLSLGSFVSSNSAFSMHSFPFFCVKKDKPIVSMHAITITF
jgi:hypothetical protein